MVTKTIYQEVAVDVSFDIDDFSDDELIAEIEDRGFFLLDKEDSGSISEAAKDEIYELYRDYISRSPSFEENLKAFFENYTDSLVR